MNKAQRPVQRKFWSFLKLLPQFIRAPFLRSQFKICDSLPEDLVFKQAETEEEISAALELVYDSYLKLNYIDSNSACKRLTKFQLLPTTVILIIKIKDEVVGTLSIILDSAMKLPSDSTIDLSKFRIDGAQIAEISSLCIKRSEHRRGKLLLPLCKFMYMFCKDFLKIDGIVVSTVPEVEAFYTDLLLFEKIRTYAGLGNKEVKNNPSTWCYLSLKNQEAELKYKNVYDGKSDSSNLYKYFVETVTPNILLPKTKLCLQSYTHKQVSALSKMIAYWPEALHSVSLLERQIISNLNLVKNFSTIAVHQSQLSHRNERFETREEIKISVLGNDRFFVARLINISESGLKILIPTECIQYAESDVDQIQLHLEGEIFSIQADVVWTNGLIVGCKIRNNYSKWSNFVEKFRIEFFSQSA